MLHNLTALCGVAGVFCLALASGGKGGAGNELSSSGEALLLVAAAAGWAGVALLRRDVSTLARRIVPYGRGGPGSDAADRPDGAIPLELRHSRHAGDGRPRGFYDDETDSTLGPLVGAVNGLLESTEQCVADAAMKAKELEVLLRVATAERQHAEAILHSISDAVFVTNPFDEIVLANESAARTFGFDLCSASRASIDSILRDGRTAQMIRDVRHGAGRGARRTVEHPIQTPAGPRTFRVTLSPVADASTISPCGESRRQGSGTEDARPGVVAVFQDVTREKELSDMKSDFVSMVSHELRTPLASIKAYVEMLIDGEAVDDKTQREFYDVIQNEANRLGRLIDNILNISRIESGLVKADIRPQSLTVVIKEALEVIAPQAARKGLTTHEELTPVFYQTPADRDMLYQAVLNLLSNSVKYTPAGGSVTIRTSVDETKRRVVTRIIDTGVGVPAADLPFVFDKFYRSQAHARIAQGTGLGLSLVRHIVETVHGGRVFAESEVGKGSCFGFELALCG